MKRLMFGLMLMLASASAFSATRYVRTDGGTATQCTGASNVAYPGSGTGVACAWNHPNWALGLKDGAAARISGGDTLVIGTGSYSMGQGGGGDQTGCSSSYAYDCYTRPIPSGTSGNPTRIVGAGHDTGCKVKPELWGTQRVSRVINMQGSSYVEIRCMEITDRSSCIEFHYLPERRCVRDTYPYGDWASAGVYASDSSEVYFQDLDIHGLANKGIHAGRLNNWELNRVRIAANGWVGWDGDIGSSNNTGTMEWYNVEVAWNGCTEDWPTSKKVGCWGQTDGGYGDGVGTAATGGDWIIEDSTFHHNTSDGLDLLYLNLNTSNVTIRRVRSYMNAGNQIKTSGTLLMENTYVQGYCQFFFGRFGTAMPEGDSCRASGNALSISVPPVVGNPITLRYNTITGTGDCLILLGGPNTVLATTNVNIENNALIGQVDWFSDRTGSPGEKSCLSYNDVAAPTVNFRSNLVYQVKYDTCPATSTCANPNIRDVSAATFDPRPTSSSALRNSGNVSFTTPSTDINGRSRPQEASPTRGAFEYKP